MKKYFQWFSIILFLLFLLSKTEFVYAEMCTPFCRGCSVTGDDCKTKGFNCNDPHDLSKAECDSRKGCYEAIMTAGSITMFNQCFLPTTATPVPDECGYFGRRCCEDREGKWSCHPGEGNPVTDSLGMSCACQELSPVDYCKDNEKCITCTNGTKEYAGKGRGAWTAIGCIPVSSLNSFAGWVLPKVIGVASGIAFLLMVFGAIQILTSAGNPEKVKAGKELITSALSGLLFIILSLFLLKLIGVDILQIPGLGKK